MLWAAVAKFCSISRMKVSAAFSRASCFLNLMEEGTMTTVLAISAESMTETAVSGL